MKGKKKDLVCKKKNIYIYILDLFLVVKENDFIKKNQIGRAHV